MGNKNTEIPVTEKETPALEKEVQIHVLWDFTFFTPRPNGRPLAHSYKKGSHHLISVDQLSKMKQQGLLYQEF